MKFPFKICKLSNDEKDVFNKYYSENGKYIFEGVWFRSQNEVNRNQSLWTDDSCNRRRTIHFRHEFELVEDDFCMRSSYLYLSTRLPIEEYNDYVFKIKKSLNNNNYKENNNVYQKDDIDIIIEEYDVHPMENYINNYKTVDITIKSSNIKDTKKYYNQLWNLQVKGIREKDKRGNPTYVNSFSDIEKYLPAQVELGCGPSIEAGIEPLYYLHEVYKVQRHSDGLFYFGSLDDLVLQVIEKDVEKYKEFSHILVSCIKAKPTKFHTAIKKLYDEKLLVGELFNNNFDHLLPRFDIKERLLRVYNIDNYFPKVEFDENAKSLICIGTHADRRKIQAQAREKGLKIIYVDPEGFYSDNGFEEYLIEGAKDDDIIIKLSATSFADSVNEYLDK